MNDLLRERVIEKVTYPTYLEWRREFEDALKRQSINLESLVATNKLKSIFNDVEGVMQMIQVANGLSLYEAVPGLRVHNYLIYKKNIHLDNIMDKLLTESKFFRVYNKATSVDQFLAMLMNANFRTIDIEAEFMLLSEAMFDVEYNIEEKNDISDEDKKKILEEVQNALYEVEYKACDEFTSRVLDHAIGRLCVSDGNEKLVEVLREVQAPYLYGKAC